MTWLHRASNAGSLRRGLIIAAGAITATQVAVASAITAQDLIRRRHRTEGKFPTQPPVDTEVGDSQITTYTSGQDLFEHMVAAIDQATDVVYLESYIWKGDEWGAKFRTAINDAAQRGVRAYVIYDGFANLVVKPSFYKGFHPDVQVIRFPVFRPSMFGINMRHSGRDHRKILSVDNRIGFVGGYNIGSLFASAWRDTHLRVQGDASWELSDAFADFWNQHRGEELDELPSVGSPSWNPAIQAHRNSPNQLLFPVRGVYLDSINRAQRSIHITQGYFIPDHDILDALLTARHRDVSVRVIIPENSNHVLADWAARGFYTEMLEAGIEIYLFQHAMVHAKTMVVDGKWTTVGSANIDRLSMIGNYEINMSVVADSLAEQMEQIFQMDLSNSRRLTAKEWESRNLLSRFSELVMGTLRPVL